MENIYNCLLLALILWLGNYVMYLMINHGLAPNAKRQQLFRYLPASVLAVLPLAITGSEVFQPAVVKILIITELWALAYPLTYHLTFRKTSPDYDHQIDAAFALYMFGVLSGCAILLPSALMAVISVATVILPLSVVGYYVVYRYVIDMKGMMLMLLTNYNEILEFFRVYSLWRTVSVILATLFVISGFAFVGYDFAAPDLEVWMIAAICILIIVSLHYMFKPHHSLFSRIGVVKLFLDVKEYNYKNSLYLEHQKVLTQKIETKCLHALSTPHTFLLVIGESASRDFMSAFKEMDDDTTPWLRQLAEDKESCILFPNAYSCDIQTVPVLEKYLTSYNQYDGGEFNTSTSIINIARSLGYKIHWYSNQGHLGSADTPVTLVAETSDVAKWTNQQLGKKYYDEALVDFLKELNPACNNLLVLHLKGSHFNYENRFPESYRRFKGSDVHDKIANYKNTLYYTDDVMRKAFERLKKDMNLQGMVYCSDHGDVPDRHRQPNFGGFTDTRIPLCVWLGDEFIAKRKERVKALHNNSNRYWTNDLLYDLMCGMLDVECKDFKEENSLASDSYRHEYENLTILNGTVHISDDETMMKGL